jgi:GTP-binding protein HflX
LFVVDASDPAFRSQFDVTRTVLKEIGVDVGDAILVLNKIDRVDPLPRAALKREFPNATLMSALDKGDVKALREKIVEHFERGMEEATIVVPYARQAALGSIRESARVVKEDWDEDGARLVVRTPKENLERLRTLIGG